MSLGAEHRGRSSSLSQDAEVANYPLQNAKDWERLLAQGKLFQRGIDYALDHSTNPNIQEVVAQIREAEFIIDAAAGPLAYSEWWPKRSPKVRRIFAFDMDKTNIDIANERAAKVNRQHGFDMYDECKVLKLSEFPKENIRGADLFALNLVTTNMPKTMRLQPLEAAFESLRKGGIVWTRDILPSVAEAVLSPKYQRAQKITWEVMRKLGLNVDTTTTMPNDMQQAGFQKVIRMDDVCPLGVYVSRENGAHFSSHDALIAAVSNIDAMRGLKKFITREINEETGSPFTEQEWDKLLDDARNELLRKGGVMVFRNYFGIK